MGREIAQINANSRSILYEFVMCLIIFQVLYENCAKTFRVRYLYFTIGFFLLLFLQVHADVRERIRLIKEQEAQEADDPAAGTAADDSLGAATPAEAEPKRGSTDGELFGFLMVKESRTETDELQQYLDMPVSSIPDSEMMDLLTWWKVQVRFLIAKRLRILFLTLIHSQN